MSCSNCCGHRVQEGSFMKGKYKGFERAETIIKVFDKLIHRKRKSEKLKNPALIFEDQAKYNFIELSQLSTRVAHVLSIELGELLTSNTDSDLIVGYCLFPSAEVILVILSILKLGAGYMSFDVGSTPKRLIRQVGLARPISILIDEDVSIVRRFEAVSKATKLLSINYVLGLALKTEPSRARLLTAQPHLNVLESPLAVVERIAAIVFTSGSTGYPRPVRITHQAIVNAVKWYNKALPFDREEEVNCLCSPTDTMYSIIEIFGSLCSLIPLVILDRGQLADPLELLTCVHKQSITRLYLQPAYLNRLVKFLQNSRNNIYMCRGLKFVLTTSSNLPLGLARDFFLALHPRTSVESTGRGDESNEEVVRKSIRLLSRPEIGSPWLVNIYGLAEYTGPAAFQVFRDVNDLESKVDNNKVPLGRPIFNTIIYLMDEDEKIVDLGQVGEICVAGLSAARGYCGLDSCERFVKNSKSRAEDCRVLVRTGDYGRIVVGKDGLKRLFIEKRMDMLVRVHGRMYDLAQIHNYISLRSLCEECVVVCYNPRLPDQRIVVACVFESAMPESAVEDELRNLFEGRFVAEVFSLEEIPLQYNGRLDHERLLNRYSDHRQHVPLDKFGQIGLSKDEIMLAKRYCELVAKAMAVSMSYVVEHFQKSFFDIGGDSLNTLAVVMALRRDGMFIELSEFINAGSLVEILMLLIKRKSLTGNQALAQQSMECSSMAIELFSFEQIPQDFDQEVTSIVSKSYAELSELCYYGKITENDISTMLKTMWDSFVKTNASSKALSRYTEEIVGVILCRDFPWKPSRLKGPKNKMAYLMEFFQSCNQQAIDKIRVGNSRVLAMELIGLSSKLKPQELVVLLINLVEEACEKGDKHGYDILLLASENPVIRDICQDPVKYRWAISARACEFLASDGTMPFRRALKHHVVNVYCQYLR